MGESMRRVGRVDIVVVVVVVVKRRTVQAPLLQVERCSMLQLEKLLLLDRIASIELGFGREGPSAIIVMLVRAGGCNAVGSRNGWPTMQTP